MSKMVERVARALADESFCKSDVWERAGYLNDERKADFIGAARAAIAAMRDSIPQHMFADIERALPRGGIMLPGASVRETFNAVIDAALKE